MPVFDMTIIENLTLQLANIHNDSPTATHHNPTLV